MFFKSYGLVMRTEEHPEDSDVCRTLPVSLIPSMVPRDLYQQAVDVQPVKQLLILLRKRSCNGEIWRGRFLAAGTISLFIAFTYPLICESSNYCMGQQRLQVCDYIKQKHMWLSKILSLEGP